MRPRTIAVLVVIGILAIAGGWYFGTAQQPTEQQAYNGGRLMFPDLASKLPDAAIMNCSRFLWAWPPRVSPPGTS